MQLTGVSTVTTAMMANTDLGWGQDQVNECQHICDSVVTNFFNYSTVRIVNLIVNRAQYLVFIFGLFLESNIFSIWYLVECL